jgi:hypothetical protein
MEAARTSETMLSYHITTQRHNTQDLDLNPLPVFLCHGRTDQRFSKCDAYYFADLLTFMTLKGTEERSAEQVIPVCRDWSHQNEMCEARNTHGKNRIPYKVLVGSMKRRGHLSGLGVDGSIISKWIQPQKNSQYTD